MIRAGLVGMGRMGISHFAIINSLENVDLVSVAEPSGLLTTLVDKHTGVKSFKDYEKMIESMDLNCIFITTPTKFHYDMVKKSLEAGLHVFVEKPFCLTPEQSRELIELAESKNLVNQVGYHNRFIGTFREAKRLVEKGAIGEVYHVIGEAYGPVVLREKSKTWRTNSNEGGGCLYDYAAHVINLMQFISGSPRSVSGTILKKIYSADVDDAVYSTFQFDEDKSGQISVNWSDETYRKMSTQITLLGKKGKISVDAQEMRTFFKEQPNEGGYEKGWNKRWVTGLSPEVSFYLRGEEYSAQMESFVKLIQDGGESVNSFRSAGETDQIIAMIQNDSQKQQEI